MTTLTLHYLTKSYAGRRVIDRLALEAPGGQITALLGPSGSGKSTVLKMIAGLEAPDAGDIRLDGESILDVPAHRRGAVLMFQKAYLFPFLSVAENIAFGLRARRLPRAHIRAEVQRMLKFIGLPGMAHRRPASLSGGEQQRVALARALVVQPRVLLLDEPFGSLDTPIRRELQSAVRDIQRALGITTILVTHDLDEAMAMADRVALLLDGQLQACDTPERLYRRPPSRCAAQFLGVSTFLEGVQRGPWLETPLGRLRVACEPPECGRAVYGIRPEHVRVSLHPCEEALPAEVTRCTYRGDYLEVQAQSAGVALRAHVPMPAERLKVGTRLYLRFPPQHLFPLAEGATARPGDRGGVTPPSVARKAAGSRLP